MKTSLILFTGFFLATLAAGADQAASWSCANEKVTLTSKTTYWGEGPDQAKLSQTLYTLAPHAAYDSIAAYFLDVEEDIGKFGALVLTGKNEVGATFSVTIRNPSQDTGDGTVVRKESVGVMTYQQGSFKGTQETVNCIYE